MANRLKNRLSIRVDDSQLLMIRRIQEELNYNLSQSELVRNLIETLFKRLK